MVSPAVEGGWIVSLQYLLNALRPALAKLPEVHLSVKAPAPHASQGCGPVDTESRQPTRHDEGWLPPRTK
jgi:hypothetical protein